MFGFSLHPLCWKNCDLATKSLPLASMATSVEEEWNGHRFIRDQEKQGVPSASCCSMAWSLLWSISVILSGTFGGPMQHSLSKGGYVLSDMVSSGIVWQKEWPQPAWQVIHECLAIFSPTTHTRIGPKSAALKADGWPGGWLVGWGDQIFNDKNLYLDEHGMGWDHFGATYVLSWKYAPVW